MKKLNIFILIILLQILTSCFSLNRLDYRKGMNTNVCKDLHGDVLLYCIFVDNKNTAPWTEFDIQTTLDSINIAINWLHNQAKLNNINLNIISDYYIGDEYTTIKKNLPQTSVQLAATEPNLHKGILSLNKWSDYIARKTGDSFQPPTKDGIPQIKKPKNKERLIAFLRDEYNVESVALLFLVNNYYKNDISIPVNTMSTKDVEYAIVSYKYPSEIAHNFLHLYGAADLYKTIYKKNEKNINFAAKEFPNEIMLDPYAKKINNCEINIFTKYLIGWTDTLPTKYTKLFYDNRILTK